ncbi:MAG: hypothetical protein DRP50_07615 [Thermotoga sp.]|nr:MAG: hypothetical protein DRP50_07615 [Thermotoga sp.]
MLEPIQLVHSLYQNSEVSFQEYKTTEILEKNIKLSSKHYGVNNRVSQKEVFENRMLRCDRFKKIVGTGGKLPSLRLQECKMKLIRTGSLTIDPQRQCILLRF